MTDRGSDPPGRAPIYDVAVIGGGINGCGIAADAAGRGLSVLLVEQGDLAGGTSSASSKLIHGGLRYLEHYEFRLVRESLEEREVLLANAPHLIWPLRFVVPHTPHMRSRLLMRAGLFLYDHLARRQRIPGSGTVDLAHDPAARPLAAHVRHAFHYSDCWVDDARLVVAVAQLAAKHGAHVLTRTPVVSATDRDGAWHLTIGAEPFRSDVRARTLVNAAGPWAGCVSRDVIRRAGTKRQVPVRLVKGSHIVVPRIPGAEDAYLLQADDRRVVFLLPFADRFTLIGTTDVAFDADPAAAACSDEEQTYLLRVANSFLRTALSDRDIAWRFAGVRPLYDDAADDPSAITRDYRLELEADPGQAPLLTVVGGKVTTYRRLAEAALATLRPHLGSRVGGDWTVMAPLPGGDMPGGNFAAFAAAFLAQHRQLGEARVRPLLRRYGTAAATLLAGTTRPGDLGEDLGCGITEREVAYLVEQEWVTAASDVLWRRTKAGLLVEPAALPALEARIERIIAAARHAAPAALPK